MSLLGGVIPIKTISFFVFCIAMIASVGYGLGRIKIKGISMGTSGVFIVALIFGCCLYPYLDAQLMVTGADGAAVSFTGNALKIVENIGLVFFVTAIGFIAGPKFFGNFKRNFKSYVVMAIVMVLSGALCAVLCIFLGRGLKLGESKGELTAMVVGLLSGALTSTPAFSAAKATVDPAFEASVTVGHGIAYIFGVLGIVFFVQFVPRILHADMEKEREKIAVVSQGENKNYERELLKLDNFSFLPFFFAVALGIFIGSIKIPLTSDGLAGVCFNLTSTGGCLLTSLVFGHFGRIGRVRILPTEHTLKVFRELGLMLFLIGAGVPGGAEFVAKFDIWYFVFGVIMTTIPLFIGFFFAKYVLKLSLLNNLGSITGGRTSTPALGTLIDVAGTEDVASSYAACYPVALIAVVLSSQFLIILFS